MSTTAAVYARFSTERQDPRSIDEQIRRCKDYAARHGFRVTAEYSDAAMTGTNTHRPGLQSLLADAGRRKFRKVLVDDLSRLSRDLGDTWNLVFGTFASMDVEVVDCSTGIGSNHPAARMSYGAMGLVSDGFVQMIRHETHRNLEGRALEGFHTGGKTFGYATVEEPDPRDPLRPRRVPVIEEGEAKIVREIFAAFLARKSCRAIADELNRRGLPAPHDTTKGNKYGRGWQHTTIRSMLQNERYRGRLSWNTTKWIKNPTTKKRRRIERPREEWVVRDVPELAIVDQETFDAAQGRFKRRVPTVAGSPRGRPSGSGKYVSLFSGFLRCGVCQGPFNVITRKVKGASVSLILGCATYRSRGAAICANNKTVTEAKILATVAGELRKLIDTPAYLKLFVDEFTRQLAEAQRSESVQAIEAQITECDRRIKNATDALLRMGFSEAIQAALRAEEDRRAQLRDQLANARRQVVVPHPAAIAGHLKNLVVTLGKTPTEARPLLERVFPQPLVLTPGPDGYSINGGILVDARVGRADTEFEISGSGGLQPEISNHLVLPMRAPIG